MKNIIILLCSLIVALLPGYTTQAMHISTFAQSATTPMEKIKTLTTSLSQINFLDANI